MKACMAGVCATLRDEHVLYRPRLVSPVTVALGLINGSAVVSSRRHPLTRLTSGEILLCIPCLSEYCSD
jgi:hypothetical protein